MILISWSSLSLYFKKIGLVASSTSFNLKTDKNFSFRPSNESWIKISSALPPFSELIFGRTGFDACGLKLHLKVIL